MRDARHRGVVPSPTVLRLFDLAGAIVLGLATAPVWLTAAVALYVTEGPPVLYAAVRIGRDGTPFVLYKFRTMERAARDGLDASHITADDDGRVTTVGSWLRRSKIDELPQLWNVIRGEMGLVGPRPEDPRFVRSYSRRERRLLSVRPGITSPASVAFRDEARLLAGPDPEATYRRDILPRKLGVDLEWLENRSLVGDWKVLVATARALARRPT